MEDDNDDVGYTMFGHDLTKRQRQLLDYLREFYYKNKYMPTYKQIKDHMKMKSISSVAVKLYNLREKGYIEIIRFEDRINGIYFLK